MIYEKVIDAMTIKLKYSSNDCFADQPFYTELPPKL